MNSHNKILDPLKRVTTQAVKQNSSWNLQEVIDVIEAYAEEVGGSEIEVLEYMVHGIGPLVRGTKSTATMLHEKASNSRKRRWPNPA